MKRKSGIPVLLVGIVFLAYGVSGHPPFLGIAVVFLAIGVALLARRGRADSSK